MSGIKDVNGSCSVQIVSASLPDMLTAVSRAQIELRNVREVDALTLQAMVSRSQYAKLEKLLAKRGEHCHITGRGGLYWRLASLIRRPVLMLGLAIMLAASLYLPTRVLFIQVEGNNTVSTYQILEKAEQCGIRMGASRSAVRSEKMKNNLLMMIPQLKWAGINTKGCTAVITVTEREIPTESGFDITTKRVVADRDGIIASITTTRGTALCTVGQAVTKGQVLVSPYTDCGISIKLTDAEAEVMAVTNRTFSVKYPYPTAFFSNHTEKHTDVSLLIGKKRIKIYNGSGNCRGVCDKIYEEKFLTLPGGFRLPVAIVLERTVCRSFSEPDGSWQPDIHRLEEFTEAYLRSVMVSGEILSRDYGSVDQQGCVVLEGKYSCLEMIGKLQDEEIVRNEQRD